MPAPDQHLPSPTRIETLLERELLAGVPVTKHGELLPLLRSSDRTVREVALVLIQLDREAAARRTARRITRRLPGVAHGW